jgi:hypothetical protein
LLALPPVNHAANRNAIRELGPVSQTIPIFDQLVDSRSIFLTANDNTVYSQAWLNLNKGPLVVEVPPKVRSTTYGTGGVIDVGITGPDKARAANICCCRLVTRVTSRPATKSCAHGRSICGSLGVASSLTGIRSRVSTLREEVHR